MNHFIYRQSFGITSFDIINKYNEKIGKIVFNAEQNKYGWITDRTPVYITEEQTEEILDKLKFLNKNKNLSYPERIELLNKD